ncbi:MAG: carboxymuconolactone decarboxylase family protein [Acidimicrobiia bacterium]
MADDHIDRDELRRRGNDIKQRLQHGTNPPRKRPLQILSLPGMQAYVDEALFGSLWARPGLDLETRCSCVLGALTALGQWQQLRTYLNSALNVGLSVRTVQETLIQCAPFCGFPSLVNAMQTFDDVLTERGLSADRTEIEDLELPLLESLGRRLHREVFGDDPGSPDNGAARAVREVEVRYVYGAMFHRPGLDRRVRVLVAITCLVCIEAHDELKRWAQGALRVGLSRTEIDEAIAQCAYYAGFPRTNAALAAMQ